MKVILSVPAHWQKDPHYAPLKDTAFLHKLQQDILQGLHLSRLLYQESFGYMSSINVDWVAHVTNPQPFLLVEVRGNHKDPITADINAAAKLLGVSLSIHSSLATLIPDCVVYLEVCFRRSARIRPQ